jgi:hypothetical protein
VKPRARVAQFAVVDDSGRLLSSVWRVWSHGSHVYAAVRGLTGQFKTSLHAGGRSRHAFVTDAAAERFREPGLDRAVLKWHRPDAQVPGATLLLQILMPEPGLAAYLPRYELPPTLIRLSRPPTNHVIYVSVVETARAVSTEGPRFANHPTAVLTSWRTSDGTVIWIVTHDAPLTEGNLSQLSHIEQLVTAAVDPAVLDDAPGGPPSELRGFLLLDATDGVGRVIDLSMEFVRHARARQRVRENAG